MSVVMILMILVILLIPVIVMILVVLVIVTIIMIPLILMIQLILMTVVILMMQMILLILTIQGIQVIPVILVINTNNLPSKSTSPMSLSLPVFGSRTRFMPTSMTAAPSFTISAVMRPGMPTGCNRGRRAGRGTR